MAARNDLESGEDTVQAEEREDAACEGDDDCVFVKSMDAKESAAKRGKKSGKKKKNKKKKKKKDKKKQKKLKKDNKKLKKQEKASTSGKRKHANRARQMQGPSLPEISSSSSESSDSDSSSAEVDVPQEFMKAAEAGKVMDAQFLIRKYGLDWRKNGDSVLHLTVRANCPGLMAWLLCQPGAESILESQNSRGQSPLCMATRLCRGCVAMRLVEALADPGACDNEGESAEGMDLDGLLREAERDELCRQAAKADRLLAAVAEARRKREELDWRRQLFETMGQEDDDFCRFESHQDLENTDTGRPDSWMDDIAAQAEARAAGQVSMSQIIAEAAAAARPEPQPKENFDPEPPPSNPRRPAAESKPAVAEDPEAAAEARLEARRKDEAKWKQLEVEVAKANEEDTPLRLREAELPWPSGTAENPLHVDASVHPKIVRSQLRAGLLRWHPDKFEQRFGRFLPVDEKSRSSILGRVKALAQQLTRLMAALPDAS